MLARSLVALWIALLACTPRPSAPTPDAEVSAVPATPSPSPPSQPAPEVRREQEMHERFGDAAAIRDAVIAGELGQAREPARRMQRDLDLYPAEWRSFAAANAANAEVVRTTRDLRVAAAAAAGLARTCGECHEALTVAPGIAPPQDVPAASPEPRPRMLRHQWAADRMWESLIDHSEYAWMAGAAALSGPPLARADLTRDVELADEVLALGDQLPALGARATAAADWSTRAELYGELLATCAGCHKGGC